MLCGEPYLCDHVIRPQMCFLFKVQGSIAPVYAGVLLLFSSDYGT